MKNTEHFKEFINDVKTEWDLFGKNSINPIAEFKETLSLIFKQHSFCWVSDEKFVDRLLFGYREKIVDDFTDSGMNVEAYVCETVLRVGVKPISHYEDLFSFAVQSKIE